MNTDTMRWKNLKLIFVIGVLLIINNLKAQIDLNRDTIMKEHLNFINKDTTFNASTFLNSNIQFGKSNVDSAISNVKSKWLHDKLKIQTNGNINLGYDYGIIPLVTNQQVVSGYYKSEGNMSISTYGIPLEVRYYYSTLKGVSGLNNFFNISFDVNKFRQNITDKIRNQELQYTKRLDSLTNFKQQITKKKAYLEMDVDFQNNQLSKFENTFKNKIKEAVIDSIKNKINMPKISVDSLLKIRNITDTSKYRETLTAYIFKNLNTGKSDSILNEVVNKVDQVLNITSASTDKYNAKKDSVVAMINEKKGQINEYKNKIAEYDEKIKSVKDNIKNLKEPITSNRVDSNRVVSRLTSLLFEIKRLDVGMCYPNYSQFLLKGATLSGINLEYESKDYFFAFTHGVTLNTFVQNGNVIENNLNQFKQMFDFLNFNELNMRRRITAIKFGVGRLNDSHLHVGLLYGIGSSSYGFIPNNTDNDNQDKNYVIEIDGKIKINGNNTIDMAYGKSNIEQEGEIVDKDKRGFYGIFQPHRSNALIVSFNSIIPKTKTNVTLSARLIDPFFKSYGLGYVKSDNLRYEAKINQKISKRISVGAMYRRTEDNMLSLYDYKNTLNTIGLNASVKLTKRLNCKVIYNSIQHSSMFNKENVYSMNSYITTGVLNYSLVKANTMLSLIYNYYNIKDSLQTNRFENIVFTGITQISTSFNNCFSVNVLKSNVPDSTMDNCILITNDLVFMNKKKLSIMGNAKYAILTQNDNQIGYGLKASIPIYRGINVDLGIEKIVYGSFYNYYDLSQIEKFPYYCYVKMCYKW